MSVAMQQFVDFISMVTQQYVTTQQYCNALLAGFSVGRSIRDKKRMTQLCNYQKKSSGSGTEATQPRKYNWGAT
jgi:hypothetical protein